MQCGLFIKDMETYNFITRVIQLEGAAFTTCNICYNIILLASSSSSLAGVAYHSIILFIGNAHDLSSRSISPHNTSKFFLISSPVVYSSKNHMPSSCLSSPISLLAFASFLLHLLTLFLTSRFFFSPDNIMRCGVLIRQSVPVSKSVLLVQCARRKCTVFSHLLSKFGRPPFASPRFALRICHSFPRLCCFRY